MMYKLDRLQEITSAKWYIDHRHGLDSALREGLIINHKQSDYEFGRPPLLADIVTDIKKDSIFVKEKPETKDAGINIRVTKTQKEKLHNMAERRGMTFS